MLQLSLSLDGGDSYGTAVAVAVADAAADAAITAFTPDATELRSQALVTISGPGLAPRTARDAQHSMCRFGERVTRAWMLRVGVVACRAAVGAAAHNVSLAVSLGLGTEW
eukprot:4672458-Pleurochrysis_carterae.AAC.1